MKKIIFILIAMSLTIKIQGQAATNELSTEQFNNIKVSGVLKTAIEATQGNIAAMELLFGTISITNEAEGGIGEGYRNFGFDNGLSFTFTDIYSPSYDASIESFETNSITIRDITVSVGDNINLFGSDIIFNPRKDGTKSIVFTHFNYDCCPIIIDFNQRTNIITKIAYVVFS